METGKAVKIRVRCVNWRKKGSLIECFYYSNFNRDWWCNLQRNHDGRTWHVVKSNYPLSVADKQHVLFMHCWLVHQMACSLPSVIVDCSGVQRGCRQCDGPGHPPWEHPREQFSLKCIRKWQKEKNVVTGAWCSTGGVGERPRSEFSSNLTTDAKKWEIWNKRIKKVVRNFRRQIGEI